MRQNTELLMVALELRLMAHHIGRQPINRRSTTPPLPEPLRDRLTRAAEAIEGMVRDGVETAETPHLRGLASPD